MIGDSVTDLEAAAAIGCPRHLVRTGEGAKAAAALPPHVLPVAVHDDVLAAVRSILDRRGRRASCEPILRRCVDSA